MCGYTHSSSLSFFVIPCYLLTLLFLFSCFPPLLSFPVTPPSLPFFFPSFPTLSPSLDLLLFLKTSFPFLYFFPTPSLVSSSVTPFFLYRLVCLPSLSLGL